MHGYAVNESSSCGKGGGVVQDFGFCLSSERGAFDDGRLSRRRPTTPFRQGPKSVELEISSIESAIDAICCFSANFSRYPTSAAGCLALRSLKQRTTVVCGTCTTQNCRSQTTVQRLQTEDHIYHHVLALYLCDCVFRCLHHVCA